MRALGNCHRRSVGMRIRVGRGFGSGVSEPWLVPAEVSRVRLLGRLSIVRHLRIDGAVAAPVVALGLVQVMVVMMRALRRAPIVVGRGLVGRLDVHVRHHLGAGRVLLGTWRLGQFPALVLNDDRALVVRQKVGLLGLHHLPVMVPLDLAGQGLVGLLHLALDFHFVEVGRLGRLVGRVAEHVDVGLGLGQSVGRSYDGRALLVVARHRLGCP